MSLTNTATRYGSVARALHWLTALLILTTLPLGLIAQNAPYDTAEALALKAQVFSIHKTLGVSVFFVALIRILWALAQHSPGPVHPERRAETFAANLVHWALYIALVAVPLSGWIHHAAVQGFAPILWPFGQDLPMVPKSESLARAASLLHWLFAMILIASLALHVLGAVKHALIDRDGVLGRMVWGRAAGPGVGSHAAGPALAAVLVYVLGATAILLGNAAPNAEAAAPAAPAASETAPSATATTGNWQLQQGQLGFTVSQMGAAVDGTFGTWTATIQFDETKSNGILGQVDVSIDTGSMTLGSVTPQAQAAEFFDVAQFPQAQFTAQILPAAQGYEAKGTLQLRGVSVPVSLPFTLQIDGDTARMHGETSLDRRDFGMGASYGDESTIGFSVKVVVDLTATRSQ